MVQYNPSEWQHQGEPRCDRPAIVITAFGSTKRGRAAFSRFHHRAVHRYPAHDVYWAFTSKIIRQRTGGPGLGETLAYLQATGYLQVVVVPLQVFPGGEYRGICSTSANFPDLKVVVGETLMHRWKFVREVLSVVEKDFLPPGEGLNLLALHGTPMSADPVNSTYLGLEKLVTEKYENVLAASLEGVPDYEAVMAKIAREMKVKGYSRVRLLPMLLVAGMHVEQDLMGDEASWKDSLERLGLTVECQTETNSEQSYFKSLTSYPEIVEFYLQRLESALQVLS